jgi:uncharacterized protein (DUF433 family)
MITSNMARVGHPSRVAVVGGSEAARKAGLLMDSVIMADNLATLHYSEIDQVIGNFGDMTNIDRAHRRWRCRATRASLRVFILKSMTPGIATRIELDERGVPWVAGTKVKVAEIVLDKITYGSSPEEIHFQHPHLSLAQIHAALTYYYENQKDLDRQIETDLEESDRLASELSDPNFRRRLAELKRSR